MRDAFRLLVLVSTTWTPTATFMTYAPLIVVFLVLVVGAAVTLTVLWRADRAGLFRNLKAGAYVIFDEEEPVGRAQDQLFKPAPEMAPGEDNERRGSH